jgi:hypothetical protein
MAEAAGPERLSTDNPDTIAAAIAVGSCEAQIVDARHPVGADAVLQNGPDILPGRKVVAEGFAAQRNAGAEQQLPLVPAKIAQGARSRRCQEKPAAPARQCGALAHPRLAPASSSPGSFSRKT